MKSQFLLSVKEYMQVRYYANKTIESYIHWITQYVVFHNKIHPNQLGSRDVEQYLTYLAVEKKVATKTQSLALNALSFLYREIIKEPLTLEMKFQKSQLERKLPIVMTREEIKRFFNHVDPNVNDHRKLIHF